MVSTSGSGAAWQGEVEDVEGVATWPPLRGFAPRADTEVEEVEGVATWLPPRDSESRVDGEVEEVEGLPIRPPLGAARRLSVRARDPSMRHVGKATVPRCGLSRRAGERG